MTLKTQQLQTLADVHAFIMPDHRREWHRNLLGLIDRKGHPHPTGLGGKLQKARPVPQLLDLGRKDRKLHHRLLTVPVRIATSAESGTTRSTDRARPAHHLPFADQARGIPGRPTPFGGRVAQDQHIPAVLDQALYHARAIIRARLGDRLEPEHRAPAELVQAGQRIRQPVDGSKRIEFIHYEPEPVIPFPETHGLKDRKPHPDREDRVERRVQELPDHRALAGPGGPDALEVLELVLERESDPGDGEWELLGNPAPGFGAQLARLTLRNAAAEHQRSAPPTPPGCGRPALRPIQATQESTHHAQDAQHHRQQQRIADKCEPGEFLGTRVGGGGGMIAGITVRVAGGVVRCCRRAVKWSLRRGPHRWGLIDGVLSAGVCDCGDAVDVEMRR